VAYRTWKQQKDMHEFADGVAKRVEKSGGQAVVTEQGDV
jgi:hypothetical protein